MTTSKTFILSIEELCTKLGITLKSDEEIGYATGMFSGNAIIEIRKKGKHDYHKTILSLGSPFPLDECAKCDGTKEGHSVAGYCLRWLRNQDSTDTYPDMRKFEPKTAIVSGLRIIEMCKCGHDENSHQREGEEPYCNDCEAKGDDTWQHEFEPEQKIEVKVEITAKEGASQ